jgi:hypothetical protein
MRINNDNKVVGVNGSDVFSSTNNSLVDFSVRLVRGLSSTEIKDYVSKILAVGTNVSIMPLLDLCVLAFQTRNIRGGKGERKLAYEILAAISEHHRSLVVELLKHLPEYGCWRDVFTIGKQLGMTDEVVEMAAKQLKQDMMLLVIPPSLPSLGQSNENSKISLLAKWAPREKTHDRGLAKKLSTRLFPNEKTYQGRMASYRKMLSSLNRHIDTVEIKMCGEKFASIVPSKVPGRALQNYRKAFLNTSKKSEKPDRVECAEHFRKHFEKGARGEITIKAADVVFPHEVIQEVYNQLHGVCLERVSESEKDLRRGQWLSLVKKAREGGALRDCIPICDFSGSMAGLPEFISMALGILVAEINGTNKIMSFDSTPRWHEFPAGDIYEKMKSIGGNLGRGLSTDFQAAMDLVLSDIKIRRLKPNEIPKDLIVFTDMGWDSACGSSSTGIYSGNQYRNVVKTEEWQTHIQMIRENFRRAGEDMWGVGNGFLPPRIVIWNLRAEYNEFHAKADAEGVVMLSGWSPALFKVLQEEGVQIRTPFQALRAQLDDEMYDPVRDTVGKWINKNRENEGPHMMSYWT